jgi:hypothetical protein
MKLSSRTTNILKNFSTINNSILIKPGNVIETITKEQNVIGSATVEETFPIEFAIYDLNAFLNAINLVKNPVFEFSEKSVKIVGENSLINYVYCDPRMVPDTIKRKLTLPDPAFSFKLSESVLNETLKASAVIGLPDFVVVSDIERLQIILTDSKNPSSNTFVIDLDEKVKNEFRYTFKCENLKILPGSYAVEICAKGKQAIGKFKHSSDLSYYIVVEDVL